MLKNRIKKYILTQQVRTNNMCIRQDLHNLYYEYMMQFCQHGNRMSCSTNEAKFPNH
jgi:hypothetical protein